MLRLGRSVGLSLALCLCVTVDASAQTPRLMFTAATPERSSSDPPPQASTVVEERGLALWSGATSDFGVGVTLARARWTIRSITSLTTLPIGSQRRAMFQQLEIIRPVLSNGTTFIAAGGGIREEWDGTRVLIGRVLAGRPVGPGRVQGSLVVERAMASPVKRDAADVVTSLGWSRRLGDRLSLGAESIGQDLEGFWNPAEADGGAKLLVGPSLHVQSPRGRWTASVTAGPVVQRRSTTPFPAGQVTTAHDGGRHFGMFVSATWAPVLRR